MIGLDFGDIQGEFSEGQNQTWRLAELRDRSRLERAGGLRPQPAPSCAAAEPGEGGGQRPRLRGSRTRLPPRLRAPRSASGRAPLRRSAPRGRCAPRPAPPGRPSARSVPRWARLPHRPPHAAGTGIRCGLASHICPLGGEKCK